MWGGPSARRERPARPGARAGQGPAPQIGGAAAKPIERRAKPGGRLKARPHQARRFSGL